MFGEGLRLPKDCPRQSLRCPMWLGVECLWHPAQDVISRLKAILLSLSGSPGCVEIVWSAVKTWLSGVSFFHIATL
jgi:hypothetical protein